MALRIPKQITVLFLFPLFLSSCLFGGDREEASGSSSDGGTETVDPIPQPISVAKPSITARPHDPTTIPYGELSFEATDSNAASFECKIDDGAYATCTSPYSFSGIGNGGHAFFVKAIASDGTESDVAAFSWRVQQTFSNQITDDSFVSTQASISHVYVDSSNKIFISTNAGPRRSDDGGLTFTDLTAVSSIYRTYKMGKDSTGRLFAATKAGLGVSTNNGSSWTWYTQGADSSHLPAAANDYVTDLYIDAQDRIWVVSTGGLSLATGSGALSFSTKISGTTSYLSVDEANNKVYISTGGFVKWSSDDGANWSNLVANTNISALAVVGSSVYLGTINGLKVSTDSGTTWTTKTTADGLPDNFVVKISANSDGLVIVGFNSGLVITTDQGSTFELFNTQNGLGGDYISSITFDQDNGIWVSHINGYLSHSNESGAISESPSDLTIPTVTGSLTSGTIKALSQPLSWTLASDDASAQADLSYRVYASTLNNISTVEDAYLNGLPVNIVVSGVEYSDWVENISSAKLKLPINQNYYVTVIAMDEAGNKTAYPSLSYNVPEISWTSTSTTGFSNGIWDTAAVVFNNKMWLFGGVDNTIAVVGNALSSTNGTAWTAELTADSNIERLSHGAIVYNDKIFVLGGVIADLSYSSDVLSSSDGTSWTLETANPGWSARKSFTPLNYRNRIYVIAGGGDSSGTAVQYNDVWNYDGSSWSRDTSSADFAVRNEYSAVVYKNKMWVIGGIKSNPVVKYQDVWTSANGSSWNQVSSTLPFETIVDSKAFVLNGELCLFGGEVGPPDSGSSYLSVVRCSTDAITWRIVSNSSPERLNEFAFFQFGEALYAIGGSSYEGTFPTTVKKGE